jgi:uncharacterized RDD family membrane protein YckC
MMEARPAGFWIRTVAALVDFSVLFLVQMSFGYIAGRVIGPDVEDSMALVPLVWVFTLLFAGAYTTVLHGLMGGQTIGKMLVNIRVVNVDGSTVSAGAALLRFAGYFASLVGLGIGYMMAGLRRDKRALHDLLAGTRVERMVPLREGDSERDAVGSASAVGS